MNCFICLEWGDSSTFTAADGWLKKSIESSMSDCPMSPCGAVLPMNFFFLPSVTLLGWILRSDRAEREIGPWVEDEIDGSVAL